MACIAVVPPSPGTMRERRVAPRLGDEGLPEPDGDHAAQQLTLALAPSRLPDGCGPPTGVGRGLRG
jgi:hypothetical protein